MRRLREQLERERDKKIEDAVQASLKARMEVGELKAALTSTNTHVHDVERKAEAALRKFDRIEEEELPPMRHKLQQLQPAGKFFGALEQGWMKILLLAIIGVAVAGIGSGTIWQ